MSAQTSTDLFADLDRIVAERAMLSHPFYVRWSEGGLDIGTLREYAKQYFAFEAAFPTFLSAVHSGLADPDARRAILANLADEEGGDTTHRELWLRFCEALGIDRADVESAELLPSTQALVDTFKGLAADPACGLGGLYAYESQAAAVARTKLDGLARFYGIAGGPGVEFFTVHARMDDWHAAQERQVLAGLNADPAMILAAGQAGADALWGFLDGVEAAYCTT
jgi:pyrroloquinoline-quinone synthase